jgi:L-fuconolactonase
MIDAHQHLWRIGRNDCAWPGPDLPAIHRDFHIGELIEVAAPLGVTGTVLVQSQPSDLDTDWLCALAEAEPFIKGVVGWADLKAPSAPARIAELARRPMLKGLRPMLQALPQDDWIADPALAPAIEAMVEAGLAFDALVYARHLPHVLTLARRHPQLTIIIDHAAKPPIAAGELEPWRTAMSAFAGLPQVCCKLSGLLTEAAPGHGVRELGPFVEAVIETFGPERLIWGSDWPVLLLAGDYAGWLEQSLAMTARLGSEAQAAIFGRNAEGAYRL